MAGFSSPPQLILIFCKALLHVRFFKDVLEKKYDIIETHSELSCLELLRQLRIDYLIIDERVLPSSSKEFFSQVEAINQKKETAVILMTKNLKKKFDQEMKKMGVAALIREPLEKENIIKVLRQQDPKNQLKNKIEPLALQISSIPPSSSSFIKHRFFLNIEAQKTIEELLKTKGTLTLLMIELDQIDQLDHSVLLLVTTWLEKMIKRYLRPQDKLLILGQGKSIMLLPKTSKTVGFLIAEEIQDSIKNQSFSDGSRVYPVTVSIGLVEQKFQDHPKKFLERFNRCLSLAIGYAALAKEQGNQIISE